MQTLDATTILRVLQEAKTDLSAQFGVVDWVTDKAMRPELRPFIEQEVIHV